MKPTTKPVLEDFKINTKIQLALLWASVMFCYVYGDYFQLYVPGKVEGLISGKNLLDTPLKLFLASVLLVIPALLVCLSVFLKPTVSRWVNITFGICYTALMTLIALTSWSEWHLFYVFLAVVESLLTLWITIIAIKWPKVAT
jgi:hypothetical protein